MIYVEASHSQKCNHFMWPLVPYCVSKRHDRLLNELRLSACHGNHSHTKFLNWALLPDHGFRVLVF
jgi:hypothetical protein